MIISGFLGRDEDKKWFFSETPIIEENSKGHYITACFEDAVNIAEKTVATLEPQFISASKAVLEGIAIGFTFNKGD